MTTMLSGCGFNILNIDSVPYSMSIGWILKRLGLGYFSSLLSSKMLIKTVNINSVELYSKNISHINIGSGEEVSIKELALLIKNVVGFKGDLVFNTEHPDGMPRKLLDVSILNNMDWKSKIKLDGGLKSVYNWYLKNTA